MAGCHAASYWSTYKNGSVGHHAISTGTARPTSCGGTASGLVAIWLMNGTSISGMGTPAASDAGLDDPGRRRLQRRRQGRHPVAAHLGRRRHLAHERHQHREHRRAVGSRDRTGRSRASATSTGTARPTSCGGTPPGLVAIWLMNGTSVASIGAPFGAGTWTGRSRASATSTATARPTSCGGTPRGSSPSGS